VDLRCQRPALSQATAAAFPDLQPDGKRQGPGQNPSILSWNCGGCDEFLDSSSALPPLSPPVHHLTKERWAAGPALQSPPHCVPDYMTTIMMMPAFQIDAALLEYSITHPMEPIVNEAWLDSAMHELTGPIPAL